jgi:hypothetical protein
MTGRRTGSIRQFLDTFVAEEGTKIEVATSGGSGRAAD